VDYWIDFSSTMISQTVEYALRAMVRLAEFEPGQAASSETLAMLTQAPAGYLSKVLRDLVVAGLVTSQRGPSGGFALARSASQITMLDVVNAVDEIPRIRECPLGNPAHVKLCPLHQRIDRALDLVEREFRRTTLAEVVESGRKATDGCPALIAPTVRKS
jgi:Rrf2 family nitric oxide-sensitive transcriptional repressor